MGQVAQHVPSGLVGKPPPEKKLLELVARLFRWLPGQLTKLGGNGAAGGVFGIFGFVRLRQHALGHLGRDAFGPKLGRERAGSARAHALA